MPRNRPSTKKSLPNARPKRRKPARNRVGKQPKAPVPGPKDKDQVNLTDEESRIMPVSGGGFDQCYNAQASVDIETMLIVGRHLSQNPNDKLEIEPALAALGALPEQLGTVDTLLADAGYYSETNTDQCLEDKDSSVYLHRPRSTTTRDSRNDSPSHPHYRDDAMMVEPR